MGVTVMWFTEGGKRRADGFINVFSQSCSSHECLGNPNGKNTSKSPPAGSEDAEILLKPDGHLDL